MINLKKFTKKYLFTKEGGHFNMKKGLVSLIVVFWAFLAFLTYGAPLILEIIA